MRGGGHREAGYEGERRRARVRGIVSRISGASFLGRVIRRHPSNPARRWPGEDLLTDITAAVIEQIPGMGRAALAQLALGSHVQGEVLASTQESPGEGRHLDLVLRDEGAVEVWVEVKDWAGESGDQLETYDRLRRSVDRTSVPLLVYLTRVGAATASVAGVRTVRWQELAEHLRTWEAANPDLGPEHRWLIADYLGYLSERGLVMSEPFPNEAREIVAKQWGLWETLNQLLAMLRERLEHRGWEAIDNSWAQKDGGSIDVWPGHWWSVYRADPAGSYPACDFEVLITGLAPDDQHTEPRFNAGVAWRSDREGGNPIADPDWLGPVLGISFTDDARFSATTNKLHRSIAIAEFPGPSLAHHADAMAEFAHDTFAALQAHPPDKR